MRPSQQAIACASLILLFSASRCDDGPVEPLPEKPSIPEPTSPANVLMAIEQLYEDTSIEPAERARLFATLLTAAPGDSQLPAFIFRYGLCDIECPWSGWGYEEEIRSHEAMFDGIYRIELELNAGPEYDYGSDGRGRKAIHSPGVTMRLWANETEFIERHTSLHTFVFTPAAGRWYLSEWNEYISSAMWGDLKAQFLQPPPRR